MSQEISNPDALGSEPLSTNPEQLPTVGKSIAWLAAFAALFYGAGAIYGTYLGLTQPDLVSGEAGDALLMEALLSPASLVIMGLMQAAMVLPAVLFASHFSHQHWRDTLAVRAVSLKLIGFWLLVYCGYFVVQAIIELIAPADLGDVMTPLSGSQHLGLAVIFVVVAPLVEELVFRGYLFKAWRHTRLGLWGTLVLTSMLFTALHLGQYSGMLLVYLFAFSIILGLAREKTGSIVTPLVLHVVNNVIGVIALVYLGIT